MSTKQVLLPLHRILSARSANQRKQLNEELASLRDFKPVDSTGDSADMAFETSNEELSSRFAERDARELRQIERAAARLTQGLYGICEGGGENCLKRISRARLIACPDTTLCINCEREMEKHSDWLDRRGKGNWGQVFASESRMEEQLPNLSEMELEDSSKGPTTFDPWHFHGFLGPKRR